jgi:hypothetical protein
MTTLERNQLDLRKYKLIIFDLDDTLTDRYKSELRPGIQALLKSIPRATKLAIATNKGNVGLYWWMKAGEFGEPDKSPQKPEAVTSQVMTVARIMANVTGRDCGNKEIGIYMSFAF